MQLTPIVRAILRDYALPLSGDHGVAHWARVLENGQRLSAATGANPVVVSLFAILHDSRRVNELSDPDHGQRAADFAVTMRGTVFELPDDEFSVLYQACAGHTHERTHPNVTVQTCWDSDRLDLGRVGVSPHPRYLSTAIAKDPETIRWADGRARMGFVPEFVLSAWQVDLGSDRPK